MKTAAIIVAAGSGQRAGDGPPKQLRLLGGRRVLDWSLDAFARHAAIDEIVVVCPPGQTQSYQSMFPAADHVVAGGETRALSVQNGLAALGDGQTGRVLVHDAARPGLDASTIDALLAALERADGAAPALIIFDALKRWADDKRDRLTSVDRNGLYRVQTPQAFRFAVLQRALAVAGADVADDLEAVEAIGARIELVYGSERLSKITIREDFERMAALLAPPPIPRMGSGFDVHAFEPGDHVTLCGIVVPHSASLKGHSDADVGWHALTDAILGALSLGDIGDHFPPSDPRWRGAPSDIFLREAMRLARERGYELGNCDITLICEAPKIKPHRETMRERTAQVLAVPVDRISVKATTTEGLGFTGRAEGIAAQAAAVLVPASPNQTEAA